jgi:hypothetical protein
VSSQVAARPSVDSCWTAWPCEVLVGLGAREVMARIGQAEAAQTRLAVEQARDMAMLRDLRLAEQAAELAGASRSVAAQAAAFDEHGWVASEIGMTLGLSPTQVRARLDFVDALERYPRVAALTAQGGAPVWTLQRLVDHLDELSGVVSTQRLGEVEAQTVAWLQAGRRTVAQLNRRMRRIIAQARAEAGLGSDDDAAQAHTQREVRVRSRGDGTADVWARLPEPDALAVAAALATATAARGKTGPADECRTLAQRRADVLVACVTGVPALYGLAADVPVDRAGAGTGAGPGVGARIDVTIPVRTLTGEGESPGEVPGYGVVPSATARDLAATPGASFRGVLFDADTGRLVGLAPDLGRVHWVHASQPAATYQHPPVMDALLQVRDVRCRAPGCGRVAANCDADHINPWPAGQTSLTNTCCLCRYHHRLKTHAVGWQVQPGDDDALVWTTPTGHSTTTEPHDYRNDDPDSCPDDDEPPF